MKHLFIFAFLLFLILSAMQAQLPTKLNQQGFLTDTMGVPLNGIFNMTFNLYTDTTAGTLMFTQTIPGVPVNKGAYSVNLDVSTVSFNQQLWMETQVGASTLTPRIRLTDAPYAMNSLFLLGPNSEATGSNSIAGGKYNRARGANSVVVGGGGSIVDSNSALGNYNFIGGGRDNLTNLSTSTIAGGQGNIATGNFSTVGGGWTNTASGTESFVGGGQNNIASGDNSAATGGYNNEASGGGATVSGGRGNSATTNEAFIGGGGENVASGTNSTIGGGQFNKARGDYSSVLGGGGSTSADSNSALGAYATVAGGTGNVAAGDYSFAAGRNAKANYLGSFVWNSSSSDFSSTDTSQFLINASGGVGIGTTSPDFPFHIRTSSSLFSTKPSVLKIDAYSSLGYVDAWINFSSTSLTTTRNWSVGLDGGTNDLKFSLDDTLGNTTLFALMNDGEAELYTTGGTRTYLLDADDGGSGAEMYLYDSTGSERIQLDAQYETGSGGWIGLRNASGTRTITLNADYNGTGDGRIISSVVEITGGSDLAEPFETISNEIIEAGTLMVIDAEHPGMLKISDEAYDKKVAGIVSGAGGVNPGLLLHQDGVMSGNTPIAIAGRVYCKVDASYGSIEPGDLLTTSTTPGYAMKADSQEKSHGTIIGKAMSVLKDGRGLVLVLVNLQ